MDDRYRNLKKGIHLLNNHPHIWVIDKSHIYQSPPMYQTKQDDFYNMVVDINTNLTPLDLLNEIKEIEKKAGRLSKNKKYLPRILDIDILAFGELQVHTGLLEIPHPGISERKFVLKPWKDIAPDFSVPGFSATVSELLDNTVDPSDISMLLIFDKEDMI